MNLHNNKEVDLLKNLQHIYKNKQQIAEDLEFVNSIQKKYLKKQKLRRINIGGAIAAAAIIVLFFSLFGPSLSKIDYATTYAEYSTLLNSDINIRGNSDTSSFIENAISLYNQKRFDEANESFNSIKISDNSYSKALIYKSMIHLENNNIDSAKEGFEQCLKLGKATETRAQLGLVLASILDNNPGSAKKYLDELKNNPDKPYHKEVRKLYRRLRFRKNK
ncbi:tol-pal system YbgF family protein [Bacteroidota bacterium]